MVKTRGQGEGSIYQRKSDGRWVASITLESRKRKYFYGKSKKEVLEQLKTALHKQQQGMLEVPSKQTVGQFLEHWFEEVHKRNIRTSTYVKYRALLNKHILPVLGHIRMQKLTPMRIQAFYSSKQNEGFSSSMLLNIHALLHKAFDKAVQWKVILHNPCEKAELPPRRNLREVQPLTVEQARQLLKAARNHKLEALLTVAIATGMRRGELIGLRWSAVNLEGGFLQVRCTVNRIAGYGFVESEPKTDKSKRTIMLPPFVVEVLRKHRIQQLQLRLEAGDMWQDRDLVFPSVVGGFFAPEVLLQEFQRLLLKAGLRAMHFHDLRHSAATILRAMRVDPKTIQEILGHSHANMTMNVYVHGVPSIQQEAIEKMNEAFGGEY